jgi:protein-disulfide isomerase/uncharacterized membrane protein
MESARQAQNNPQATKMLIIGMILAAIGAALAFYATKHHIDLKSLGATDFSCNINAKFSCDEVAKSEYSEVFGIPVGALGLGYFLGIMLLLGIFLWKKENPKDTFQSYAFLSLIGVLTSAVLGLIALTVIKVNCISCIGIYVVTILQAANVLVFRDAVPRPFNIKSVFNGSAVAAIGVLVVVFGYNYFKGDLSSSKITLDKPGNNSSAVDIAPNVVDLPLARSPYAGAGEDYRRGGENAKIIITEFADFQCPGCKRASEMLHQLNGEYGDRVLMVFRNYPLDKACNPAIKQEIHRYACRAAIMARCAGQFGKFWEYHDKVYADQDKLTNESAVAWAKAQGLTDSQVNECLASKDILAKIRDDISLAERSGVDATPTIFINGRKLLGSRTEDAMRAYINMALAE